MSTSHRHGRGPNAEDFLSDLSDLSDLSGLSDLSDLSDLSHLADLCDLFDLSDWPAIWQMRKLPFFSEVT